jgi:hypothetical protein
MKRHWKLLVVLALALLLPVLLTGCAAGNDMFVERPAGFWAGLWHGLIVVITLIISLFTDKVHIYEVNNTGFWYDLGFVIGAMIALGGGGYGGGRGRRRGG